MSTPQNHFNVEWWIIRKRNLYSLIALLVMMLAIGGGFLLWRHGGTLGVEPEQAAMHTGARFESFEGDVRIVRAATRETVMASSELGLEPGDIVQTQETGRARILLIDGSTLLVRPNSVVQIRDNSADDGRTTHVRVAVDRGLVNVRTAARQHRDQTNVIETRLTQNRLAGETGASFAVRDDNTEDIRVKAGSIETTTRDGGKTNVQAGEYVAVSTSGKIARVERLLEPPAPVSPRDLQRVYITAGEANADVALRWQRLAANVTYKVEVATSPFFVASGKVSERDQLGDTEYNTGALRPGAYYWRVQAVGDSGQRSEWSEGQKFTVSNASQPQRQIELRDAVAEYIGGSIYLLRGRTQAGNTVRAESRQMLVSANGFFQLQVAAPRGADAVNLEIEDPQGNRKTASLALPKK